MRKITLLLAFMLFSIIANAQFTTGEVTLQSGMTAQIDTQANQVTLTLKGPANKWFAIGFGGQSMGAVSDVFVYDGTNNFDKVGHNQSAPTNDSTQDWTIQSNTVSGSQRTIVATRALSGNDSSDYTFMNSSASIPVIYAQGSSINLAFHASRGFTTLTRTSTAAVGSLEKLQFAMYPNPVQDNLNIVLPSNVQSAVVEIYTILGKKAQTSKLTTAFNELNISNLNAGIYLIKVIANDDTFGVKQFVKK